MRATNVYLIVGTVLLGLLPQRGAAAPIMQFDATALALGNGATVTSWAGQTSAGSPVFRTWRTPGGGPAVDFGSGASFGTATLSPSASGDFFLAAVLKPTAANAYHNVIEAQPAGAYPLLWIDTGNRYELNKGGGTTVPIGGGTEGWDIVIADSKNNLLYVNSTTNNGTGGSAYSFNSNLTFSFFHRNNGAQFRGLVAELRIYNEAIDVAAVYEELYQKWTAEPSWSNVDSSGSYTWNDAPWDTGAPQTIDEVGSLRGGGTITISDQSTLTTPGELLVGHDGSFDMVMTGGTLTVGVTQGDSARPPFGLTVGESGGNGSFTQSGGVVTAPIVNLARNGGSGTYSLNGGVLETGVIQAREKSGAGTATLNLNGGTLRATQDNAEWVQPKDSYHVAVNVQAGGAVIDTQNYNVTMQSPLLDGGGAGGLRKEGTGKLTLTGNNTYTGGTTVAGGTLQFGSNSTSGARPPGLITLQNGANLALSHNYDYVSGISLPNTTGNGNLVLLGQGTGYYSIRSGMTTTLNYTGTTTLQLDSQLGSTWRGALFVERDSVGLPTTTVLNMVSGKLNLRRNQTIAGLTGTGGFVTTDGTYTPTLVLDFPSSAGPYTYDGVIGRPPETGTWQNTPNVALQKRGTGTQILTGHHNLAGATTVLGGTLAIDGSLPATSAVTIHGGGRLAGTGTIGGPVSLLPGGVLAPGMSTGTLKLDGNLTFAAGSFFDVDIQPTQGGGSIADLVDMSDGTNTLTLSDEAFIRVHLLDGFSPGVRTSYTILSGENDRIGEFHPEVLVWDGRDYLPKFDGWKWFDVSYGNSVVLTVVPEPGTWLLLLSAVLCGLAVRRR